MSGTLANGGEDARYDALKRRFLTTLGIFGTALLIAGYRLFFTGSAATEPLAHQPAMALTQAIQRSPAEQAFLYGQLLGLKENPLTIPPFPADQLQAKAEAWITEMKSDTEIPEATIQELIAAVHAGYAVGYPEYYDPKAGREAGFYYGLRFDPTFHRDISIEELYEQLEWTKAHFVERYDLDSVTWYLFKNAFELGFYEGWIQTDPDITAKPGEVIRFIEP